MTNLSIRESFQQIDQSENPDFFVQYLDTVSSLQSVQAYKKHTYTLLEVQRGDAILDVGCGTGEDVHVLAQMVGSTGRVVGVDCSQTMIAAAQQRQKPDLPVEFLVNDAHCLNFPNNTFDRCRADRVFQHLKDPRPVLIEMVRVVRPGGRIVVCDPDWETFVVDLPDAKLTRKLLNFACDSLPNGWSGRRLLRLYKDVGLQDVSVSTRVLVFTDFPLLDQICGVTANVNRAQQAGIVSSEEVERWLSQLKKSGEDGCLFSTITGMAVSGRKP